MPNSQIKSLTVDGVTYDIVDKTSGYIATETDPTVPSWAKQNTKPSYTAGEIGAVATSAVGAASGVVPLNASSKIDSTYLPSYVDDVIEGYYYNNKFWEEGSHTTEIPGEAGKIYVDLTTDKTYRWSGSAYVEISSGTIVSVSRDLTSGTKIGTITVNGTGSDLYAPTPPTKVSDLTNDLGFVDATGAAAAAPVQSVNGQTGAVTLDAEDVGALPDDTEFAIGYDEVSAVGTAVVGTAVTTPASFVAVGDVVGEKTTISVPTAAELRWNYSSGVLTIQGIALTVAAQTVGTGNATFVGGETSLIIKERQI